MVLQEKDFQKPDETQAPPNSRVDTIRIGDMTVVKQTFQPGWQWSKHIKSLAGTNSCQAHHFGVWVSGVMRVRMHDGQEIEFSPDDAADIPPRHDDWVIGNEPAIFYDFICKTNPK